jgi:hypothetical protein
MKRIKIYYWVSTGLMALSLSLLSLMAVMMPQEGVKMFNHLGYTEKLIPLIVFARMLAIIAIVVSKFPKLKEWAYAGLVFELLGAIYSHIQAGDGFVGWMPAFIILLMVVFSYIFYSKMKLNEHKG